MPAERVAHQELAESEQVSTGSIGTIERLSAGLASPAGLLIVVPGLVVVVGIFLTLLGQAALRESTTTLGRDRLAEQTSYMARSIAASLSHADPLLDRMRELALSWTPDDPPGPLAHELRGLMQGRPGIAYLSVSFPTGAFRGLYLEGDKLRFVDSRLTPEGTIMRRYDLTGNGELAFHKEDRTTYDPRARDFYLQALRTRQRVWTKPYTFYSSRQTGITRAEPVFEPGADGALRLVLTADFDIHALSESMPRTTPLPGAKRLLYVHDGTLLAYPEGAAELVRIPLPADRPVELRDLRDPAIDAFFAQTQREPFQASALQGFSNNGEAMLAMVAPVEEFPELGWQVAAIVPERVFFASRIKHERQSWWVASMALVLALSVSLLFARHVVRVRREAASLSELARRASDRARELGSYRLVQLLGKGGMGEVWRAEHRLLAREAAIKLIRAERLLSPTRSASEVRKRFRREAQTLAKLRSRHTINLYDYGVAGDGTFFFVMELLDGMDIDALVRKAGPQPLGRVIHFLLQALSSLAEAHDAGLVHRDIKPANLFVCRAADEVDIIKVLDFGLVQSASDEPSGSQAAASAEALAASRLTQAGQLLGTPSFMSPEQILGQPTDGRADLYSLACVALWLLSGDVPFREQTLLATMMAHVTKPLPPLSTLVGRPLPTELERILSQCLEKSPADRPRHARELANSLRSIALPPDEAWSTDAAHNWWRELAAPSPGAASRSLDTVRERATAS